MNTYTAVKNRIIALCDEKHYTINKLSTESGVAPSTVKMFCMERVKITVS